jgi:hypothetical protein
MSLRREIRIMMVIYISSEMEEISFDVLMECVIYKRGQTKPIESDG